MRSNFSVPRHIKYHLTGTQCFPPARPITAEQAPSLSSVMSELIQTSEYYNWAAGLLGSVEICVFGNNIYWLQLGLAELILFQWLKKGEGREWRRLCCEMIKLFKYSFIAISTMERLMLAKIKWDSWCYNPRGMFVGAWSRSYLLKKHIFGGLTTTVQPSRFSSSGLPLTVHFVFVLLHTPATCKVICISFYSLLWPHYNRSGFRLPLKHHFFATLKFCPVDLWSMSLKMSKTKKPLLRLAFFLNSFFVDS